MKLCATWFHNIVAEKEKIGEQCVCSNITKRWQHGLLFSPTNIKQSKMQTNGFSSAVYDLTFSFVLFTGAVYQMCKLLNLLFDFPANMLRCIQRASLKYTNAKCKQMNSHQAVFDCSNLLNVLRCNVRAQVFQKFTKRKISPCLIFPIFCKISRIWFSQFVFPSLDVFVLWFNTCILKWHLDKIQFFFRFPSLDVFVLVCLISISWCVCVVHPQVGSFVRCRGRLLING